MFGKTAPDAVVFTFLSNDLFTNDPLQPERKNGAPAPSVAVRADEKDEGIHMVTALERLLMNNDRLYTVLYRLTPRRQYFERPPTSEVQTRLETTISLFREAARFCRENGVPLIVLSIPQLFQVLVEAKDYQYEGTDIRFIDRELGRLAKQEGFTWIPTLETIARTYRETGEDLYYRWDGHLNARGNLVVGEYFADQLDALLPKH
jgi:hypothetical protein